MTGGPQAAVITGVPALLPHLPVHLPPSGKNHRHGRDAGVFWTVTSVVRPAVIDNVDLEHLDEHLLYTHEPSHLIVLKAIVRLHHVDMGHLHNVVPGGGLVTLQPITE